MARPHATYFSAPSFFESNPQLEDPVLAGWLVKLWSAAATFQTDGAITAAVRRAVPVPAEIEAELTAAGFLDDGALPGFLDFNLRSAARCHQADVNRANANARWNKRLCESQSDSHVRLGTVKEKRREEIQDQESSEIQEESLQTTAPEAVARNGHPPKSDSEPMLFGDVGPILAKVKLHKIHRNGTSENHDEKPKNAFHVVELAMKHAPTYFPEGIRWQDLAKKDWAGIHRWLVKYPEFEEWATLFDFVEAGGVQRLEPPVTVGWIGSAAIGQFMPCAREWSTKGRFNIPAYRKETRDHAMGYDLNQNGTVRR